VIRSLITSNFRASVIEYFESLFNRWDLTSVINIDSVIDEFAEPKALKD